MQDRYVGDVGDYQKFGLLRWISDRGTPVPLRLGLNWYLAPDEAHNADGKHISYLTPSNALAGSLSKCDPDLYERLSVLVREGRRTVCDLELAGVLPPGALTYHAPVTSTMSRAVRADWHRQALAALSEADIIFVDPDNGLSTKGWATNHHKFAFGHEIADYVGRGQSVVIYHHADRSVGGVPAQVRRRMLEINELTGVDPIGTVVARRGSCRFFLVVAAEQHRSVLRQSLASHSGRWTPHTELWPFEEALMAAPNSSGVSSSSSADQVVDPEEGVILLSGRTSQSLPPIPMTRSTATLSAGSQVGATGSGACGCGCGAAVRRRFLPGHDAKLKSRLLNSWRSGDMTAAQRLHDLGWLPA